MSSLIVAISQVTVQDTSASDSNTKLASSTVTAGGPSKLGRYSLFQSDPNADVTFCSSDGDMFHLQRKYLEANTGAFPGSEFDTCGEITHLTEASDILHLLFQYVCPRRAPDIEGVEFKTLAALAEAAEKYEVFHAMTACKTQMKLLASKHPVEVLLHAARHDYPALIQEAAPHLIRKPIADVIKHLPNQYVLPWIRYRATWDSIFEQTFKDTLQIKIAAPNFTTKHSIYFSRSLVPEVCSSCLIFLLGAVQQLKEIDNVPELKEALEPKPRLKPSGCLSSACQYVNVHSSTVATIKTKVEEVAPFSTFVSS